jgi:nicotinamide-nucleotide amidase
MMKNTCLILTNNAELFAGGKIPLIMEIEAAGYQLTEIRVYRTPAEGFYAAIEACTAWADNLFVVLCGYGSDEVAEGIQKAFGGGFLRGAGMGAGMIEWGEKTLFLLPASQCVYLREVCFPYLENKSGQRLGSLVFRAVGADKKKVDSLVKKAKEYADGRAKIRLENAFGEDVIRVFYDENTPRMLTDDLVRYFAEQLSDNLYALEETTLEKQLVDLLKIRRKRLCVAESFTGGGIASKIVSVSGASEVYVEGLNTYADFSKMQRLGVSEFTLRSQGAVSEQTAYEMAAGLLQQGNCDVSIATTGLAGPKDDGSGLPIGTCYIAIGVEENVYVYHYLLEGDRDTITQTAIRYALFLACKHLKNL